MDTPKISVIVPVYNVEGYLERCLNSLVHQTLEEIEIIVVNDGSTDGSGDIISHFASCYPNKIKHFTQENSGVAAARNFALSQARGEFIGFVDSDDFIRTDMYEKLYEKAVEEASDVVVSGYVRLNLLRSWVNQLNDMEQYGQSLEENPMLLVCGVPYLWNKIFKRNIIENHKIRFISTKIFEDLVFTYECMLHAGKVSKVNEAFYYYRVARTDSATAVFTRNMFDVFPAMDELIAYYGQHTDAAKFRKYLLCTVLNHTVLRLEAETSPESYEMKLEFLDEVFSYLDQTFPEWKTEPFYFEYKEKNQEDYTDKEYWKKQIKMQVEESQAESEEDTISKTGFFDRFRAEKRKQEKDRKNKLYYKEIVQKMPINEKAVLIDSQHGEDMNGNMFYILQELHNNPAYQDYELYVCVKENRKKEFKKKLQFYHLTRCHFVEPDSKQYQKVLATAKYLFNDTSFLPYFIKREEQVYLNTWHGTPFKAMGKKVVQDAYKIGNLQKNFRVADYLLYPSEFMKEVMLRDYMIHNTTDNQILLTGYPRNTIYFKEPNAQIIKELGLDGKEVIAYLPTWRGNLTQIEDTIQIEEYLWQIEERLTDNQVFYVNLHPYQKNAIDFKQYQKVKVVPQTYETYDFLNCADILITDYSSVFFDYANSRKKIILFAYDEESYFSGRGVYFPFSELPFTKVTTVDELMQAVNEPKRYDDSAFLERFCPYEAADVTRRICSMMIQGKSAEEEKLCLEPMPDNKKEKVLIYAGSMRNNRNIDSLINALFSIDCSRKNYYLTFHQAKLGRNPYVLSALPEHVEYVAWAGAANVTAEEQQILKQVEESPKAYDKYQDTLERIYREERVRRFDAMEFDKIINFSSMDSLPLGILSDFKGEKIMYVHAKKVYQTRINPKLYDRYDKIYVKTQGIYDKVVKHCNPDKVQVIESTPDMLK